MLCSKDPVHHNSQNINSFIIGLFIFICENIIIKKRYKF